MKKYDGNGALTSLPFLVKNTVNCPSSESRDIPQPILSPLQHFGPNCWPTVLPLYSLWKDNLERFNGWSLIIFSVFNLMFALELLLMCFYCHVWLVAVVNNTFLLWETARLPTFLQIQRETSEDTSNRRWRWKRVNNLQLICVICFCLSYIFYCKCLLNLVFALIIALHAHLDFNCSAMDSKKSSRKHLLHVVSPGLQIDNSWPHICTIW